jgi:hypothetical protein
MSQSIDSSFISSNIENDLSDSDNFQNPNNLFKNTRENSQHFTFASNSYIITHNLFTYSLSEIDYNKVSY